MSGILRLLHPFMPFITEEIWQALPNDCESIMAASWPLYSDQLAFAEEEASFEKVVELIGAIRTRRSEMGVPPSRKAKVSIATASPEIYRAGEAFILRLASASSVEIGESFEMKNAVQAVTADARVFIPLGELIDPVSYTHLRAHET